MCSISGAIIGSPLESSTSQLWEHFHRQMKTTIAAATERGRDSWGVVAVQEGFQGLQTWRDLGTANVKDQHWNVSKDFQGVLINNNRAEPTTEYVEFKHVEDIQPFTCGGWAVAHNGTIANDKELMEKFHLSTQSKIDSAVIPAMLCRRFGEEFEFEDVIAFLNDNLVGSFALAICHESHPGKLLLMCNYKPLYLMKELSHNIIYFSSLPEYFGDEGYLHTPTKIQEIPPYSAVGIERGQYDHLRITQWNLRPKTVGKEKALVVCSGGLDSTVVAAKAIKDGYDVTLLHFLYRCRAESKERSAVSNIGKKLHCDIVFIPTNIFKDTIGGSPLTNTATTSFAESESGAEYAHEWVPARNLIMLSIATGYAEAHGFSVIMLGNNLEESGAYPDNEMQFIRKLNDVLPFATQVNRPVRIEMPVGNLMKHEIVKLGLEIGAPLDLCWSCYDAGDVHCGHCGPCYMRKTAFKINGVDDVIPYATDGGTNDSTED